MSRIFERLQIYGWRQDLENILLATLLTGDRALLISPPGAAKTVLPKKICKALELNFGAFDVNAQGFDEIIGFPNLEKMKQGIFEYIGSKGTIWGKDFVSYEELNRCKAQTQGKVLEHLRSGTIGDVPTGTKWCWANMNPIGSAGTNKLNAANIDRFTFYIWAPDLLDLGVEDRAKVAGVMTEADAPALPHWMGQNNMSEEVILSHVDTTDYKEAGKVLREVLKQAAVHWVELDKNYPGLNNFLSLFADVLFSNMVNTTLSTPGGVKIEPIRLSGRRLAMMRRAILSYRAVELALQTVLGYFPPDFRTSVQVAINATIPVGINEAEVPHDKIRKIVNNSVRQASNTLTNDGGSEAVLQYELLCSKDPIRRMEILTSGKIKDLALLSTGWQRLCAMDTEEASLCAYIATQLDAKSKAKDKDGVIPNNVIEIMKKNVTLKHVKPELPSLLPQIVPHAKQLNEIIEDNYNKDPLLGIVSIRAVHEFNSVNPGGSWKNLQRFIKEKEDSYVSLIGSLEL